jgi:nucleotide-binding universal stress UspA family protein
MIDLRRILVPTDFSKSSDNALTYAVAFAEKFGAEVLLLHVVQDASLFVPEARCWPPRRWCRRSNSSWPRRGRPWTARCAA